MKGNINKLALLMVIAVMATFVMAATVTAGSPIDITGQYAATGSGTCFVAFYGLNDSLMPNPVPSDRPEDSPSPPWAYQLLTCTIEGVFTFYGNGTGHAVRPSNPCIIHSGPPFAPAAADSMDEWDFTYKVEHDGQVTLTQVPGSHSGEFTSGILEGFAYSNENRNWHGKVSPDGKTIILNSGLPEIITSPPYEDGTPNPENLVCNVSAVLIWQHDVDYKYYNYKYHTHHRYNNYKHYPYYK